MGREHPHRTNTALRPGRLPQCAAKPAALRRGRQFQKRRAEIGSGEWGVGNGEWGIGNEEVTSIFPLQFLLQRANLVVKHLSQTTAFFQNGIDLQWLAEFNPSRENQMGFVFLQTALSNLQKANVVPSALSAISFRDIRWNRRTRFANLECHSE